MSGNTKKTEMKSPIDKVNEFEYLKDVGSTNSLPITSVNFTSSALGKGWLVTEKKLNVKIISALYITVWKFQDFSVTQILRETNSKNLEEPKVPFLSLFFNFTEALDFW